MPRPRTLAAHSRDFFAYTEELLVQPARTITFPPGPEGRSQAFGLRAAMYHFWARLRSEVERTGFVPAEMDALAGKLAAAGRLRDGATRLDLRALYRVACNSSVTIEGNTTARLYPKSESAISKILRDNLDAPPELGDGGAELLAELERTKPQRP